MVEGNLTPTRDAQQTTDCELTDDGLRHVVTGVVRSTSTHDDALNIAQIKREVHRLTGCDESRIRRIIVGTIKDGDLTESLPDEDGFVVADEVLTNIHLVWVGQTEGDRDALDSIHSSPASANDRVMEIHRGPSMMTPSQERRRVRDIDGDAR
ncbi:hypothetical protein [Halorussus salinisoli]|uniref:hypothetical protein n=1 Tax=Halorussus salinisoli TaxID=2558242 RepID=UPI0010C17624|nr:hypothetical protein [Halorussus salinisoli]